MDIVKIDRNNQVLFKDLIFDPEQALAYSPRRIGVMDGGEACGALVYSVSDERIRLHSIYVRLDKRRQGYATELMKALLKEGRAMGALFVTGNFFGRQEYVRAFLLSMGFIIAADPGIFYFPASEVISSKYVRKYLYEKKYSGVCKSFSEINQKERAMVESLLSGQGYPVLRLKEPGFQYALSFCCFDKHGKLLCTMLVFGFNNPEDQAGSNNELIIDYLLGNGRDTSAMMLMFRAFTEGLKVIDNENTMVIFQAEAQSSESIAEKLLGRDLDEADYVCHAIRELF